MRLLGSVVALAGASKSRNGFSYILARQLEPLGPNAGVTSALFNPVYL